MRIFSKNLAPSILSTYGPSTSCKIWDKSNELILRKKCCNNGRTYKSDHFGPIWPIFPQAIIFQKIQLRQLWVLMAPQLLAKCLKKFMSQSWNKCCRNGWTNNSGFLGFLGPLSGKQEFHQKIRLCQFWVLLVHQLHIKYKKN